MGEIYQNLQALAHHVVALFALDVRDKAYAARVALLARIIQALLYRQRKMAHVVPYQIMYG